MIKPVIKWSGSKRTQANKIKSFFPNTFGRYYEPFIGGGSMLYVINPKESVCGDICKPLIDLWQEIKSNPEKLAYEYELRWKRLQKEGYTVYYEIRDEFNNTKSPYDLMFLSRTCVNGLIRFNDKGEFNNSLHYSRPGIKPESLKEIIFDWSEHIQNVKFIADDYIATTSSAKSGDMVYLDPPYFHTKGRYFGTINFERFLNYLEDLNKRNINYILSFDGLRGETNYTVNIPKDLYKRHELLQSGNSTFKKVIGKETEKVFESLYMNF